MACQLQESQIKDASWNPSIEMRRRSNISFFIGFPLPACAAAAFSSEGTDTREDGGNNQQRVREYNWLFRKCSNISIFLKRTPLASDSDVIPASATYDDTQASAISSTIPTSAKSDIFSESTNFDVVRFSASSDSTISGAIPASAKSDVISESANPDVTPAPASLEANFRLSTDKIVQNFDIRRSHNVTITVTDASVPPTTGLCLN